MNIFNFQVFIRAASLGGDHSLALHPMTTTHVQLSTEEQLKAGIVDNLVRLSVGLEDSDDLIKDLVTHLTKNHLKTLTLKIFLLNM